MGPKYLQVAGGQQRSFSLRDKAVMQCRIKRHTDVLCLCNRAQSCNNTVLKKKKKRSPYDHSKSSLTRRMMPVINTHFISNSCVEHHPRAAQPVRTAPTKQWESTAKGEKPNLRQLISCHLCGLCPAKNFWSFSICLSVPGTHASVWTGRPDLWRPAVALPSFQLQMRKWMSMRDGKECFVFL